MSVSDFTGAKIALLHQGKLIAYQRDQKSHIPFPGMWDLPGGARETDETPYACAIRETWEEFGIRVEPSSIVWERYFPAEKCGVPGSYFFVAHLNDGFGEIVFGDEGQQWEIMTVECFLAHPTAVESLKIRLRDYLSEGC